MLYNIKANKFIDFSAAYTITGVNGITIGSIARKGWASLWKAHFDILDINGNILYEIREGNPWVKFWDGLMKQIPLLGLFSGYLFHPEYIVRDIKRNMPVAVIKKESSFLGSLFSVNQLDRFEEAHSELIILSLTTMTLMERHRG